jgi:predicted acetyltransferase
MIIRKYDPEKDTEALRRVWYEVGWTDKDKWERLDLFLQIGDSLVAEVDGQAESLTQRAAGVMRYLEEDLPFSLIDAVTTSHVARKRGAPKRLVARSVAAAAAEGALVTGLGMFDQGYYDQLGFGTGGYEHWVKFDPASLKVHGEFRVPQRLTAGDWEAMHASRAARRRVHGGCVITDARLTQMTAQYHTNGFGLGYRDGPNGEITHHFWASADAMGEGPYNILWIAFRTRAQFLELMSVLRSLGDQVKVMTIQEPPGIQMQDLMDRPFRHHAVTRTTRFEHDTHGRAWWQMRINDLPACLARTHLNCADMQFNLRLTDPLAHVRDDELLWRGIGGEYVVTLGADSRAEASFDPALPTLEASVNAFTRLWLGVRPATGLAYTDDLAGPEGLLTALDTAFCIPEPKPDWDF